MIAILTVETRPQTQSRDAEKTKEVARAKEAEAAEAGEAMILDAAPIGTAYMMELHINIRSHGAKNGLRLIA